MPARSIYAELKSEHKEIKGLLSQLTEASGAKRKKLFEQVEKELTSHSRAEESVFYAKTMKPKQTHELTMEGFAEHHVADLVVGEMRNADHTTDEWKAQASVLKEIVEHHISEEERHLFPKAKEVISDDQAKQLVEPFETQKQQIAQTLH